MTRRREGEHFREMVASQLLHLAHCEGEFLRSEQNTLNLDIDERDGGWPKNRIEINGIEELEG